jgi:hypothetical protein
MRITFLSFIVCLLLIGCELKTEKQDCNKLIKIEITDSCFNRELSKYIEAFPFNGKGVYLSTIKSSNDTIKYYVTAIFTEQDLSTVLNGIPYYLYDTINQRIVIIYTKFEKHFENKYSKYECDTILYKYFDYSTNAALHKEVYCGEITKFEDTIIRKIIHFNPF